jgi:glutamyl/glutaminyl-tRNA synthetase
MRKRPLEDIVSLAIPYLVKAGYLSEADALKERPRIERMMAEEKDRIEHLSQIVEKVRYYFEEPAALDEGALKILRKKQDALPMVKRYAAEVEARVPEISWQPGEPAALEAHAREFTGKEGVSLGDLAQPLRAILTGRSATPGLFEVMSILGKATCLKRLARADDLFLQAGS